MKGKKMNEEKVKNNGINVQSETLTDLSVSDELAKQTKAGGIQIGGYGNDTILAGSGNDFRVGGGGIDVLIGNTGGDR